MSEDQIEFIDSLVERHDYLRPVLRAHVEDNFGEVLPHLFFGDLTRTAVQLVLQSRADDVRALLADLEEAFANSEGDGDIANLIAVSFLENLPCPTEPGAELREMLGPRLTDELRAMG